MPLPLKTNITGAAVTEGLFKTSMDALIDFLTQAIGTVDGYIKTVRGTTAARPSATEGGWLRWNTDRTEMEMSYGTSWQEIVRSTADATWKWNIPVAQESAMRVISSTGLCKMRVESTVGSAEIGVDADEAYLTSSGTRPLRIWINGVPVFKIDTSGNLTVTGTVTQRGTV